MGPKWATIKFWFRDLDTHAEYTAPDGCVRLLQDAHFISVDTYDVDDKLVSSTMFRIESVRCVECTK